MPKNEEQVVRGMANQIIAIEMPAPKKSPAELKKAKLPATLWLFLSMNKEYPPFYRHAWGSAFVSTNAQGTDRFPVEELVFELQMPNAGGGTEKDRKEGKNTAELQADTKYYGAGAFGDFESLWSATAYHPAYGKWTNTRRW